MLLFFCGSVLLFVGLFITMLGYLMAALPPRARFALACSLSLAFVLLGWRSPNHVLSSLITTVCPAMVGGAWLVGTWRARRPVQERARGLGTKP